MSSAERRIRLYTDPPRTGDDRSEFQKDRDIILYSTAFQRLAGITQVVSAGTGHVFHNRLTHTLQVAQVGRRLAEKLNLKQPELTAYYGGLNPDVVEAACLAHDLGHPPFGHLAERVLNRLAGEAVQGFEGNAQSFRIVTELAFRASYPGLNLTWHTLRGILKYPWTFSCRPKDKENKWGAYDTEIDAFEHATGVRGGGPLPRSPEAELMDWADDLTYSIHDVEDFYRAGLIPLHLLRPPNESVSYSVSNTERDRFLGYVWQRKHEISPLANISQADLDEIFGDVIFAHFSLEGPYEGTRDDRGRLRTFTSQMVGRYINGLTLQERSASGSTVKIDSNQEQEIAILKQLTWFYVIEASSLAMQQHAQRQVIRSLFNVFMHETARNPSLLLPPYYRERLTDVKTKYGAGTIHNRRIVIDLIAGLAESQALALYQRLNGIVSTSGLEKILV